MPGLQDEVLEQLPALARRHGFGGYVLEAGAIDRERVEFLRPKTRQERTPAGEGKPYTVYCVRCFPQEGAPWEVERRFSDFYSLWYELEAAGATAVNRLDFPSRTASSSALRIFYSYSRPSVRVALSSSEQCSYTSKTLG